MSLLFGMFGVYQETAKHVSHWVGAYSANWGGYPYLNYMSGANGIVNLNIDSANSGTIQAIDWNQVDSKSSFVSNSVSTLQAKMDGRAIMHSNEDVKSFIASYVTGSFYENSYSCRTVLLWRFNGWTGIGRPFKADWIFHRPDLVKHIESPGDLGGAGEGNYFDGSDEYGSQAFKIPYFQNLQTITLIGGGRTAKTYYIREIEGAFPPQVHTITIQTDNSFLGIEKPFPKGLKRLGLSIPVAAFASDLPRLLAQVDDLEELCLTVPNYSPTSGVPISGTLDLSAWSNLKRLQVVSTGLTAISLHPSIADLHTLILRSCYNLSNSDKLDLLGLFQASPSKVFLNLFDSRIIGTGITISNVGTTDFKGLDLTANRLSGTIELSDPFTAITLVLGNSSAYYDSNSTHYKNTFSTVDLSGLQNELGTFDISNCHIENLDLPVQKAVTNFYFGGNDLDYTTDAGIVSKLKGVCKTSTIQIIRGSINTAFEYPTVYPSEFGQNSSGGLGNDLSFSEFKNLRELQLQGCKVGGELTLPETTLLGAIVMNSNDVTGIAGTYSFTGVTNLQFRDNPYFEVDLTRFPSLNFVRIQGNEVMQTFDLSAKNTATSYNQQMYLMGNNALEEIIFPSNTANFLFPNTTAIFNFSSCPELEYLTNFDKWDFSVSGVVNRSAQFIANGSPKLAKRYASLNQLPEIPTGYAWYYLSFENCDLTASEMGVFVDLFWDNKKNLWFKYASTFSLYLRNNLEILTGTYTQPANYRYQTIGSITKGSVTKITTTNAGTALNLQEGDIVTWYRGHSTNGDRAWANSLHGQNFMLKNKSGYVFDLYSEDGLTPINSSVGFPASYLANSAGLVKYGDTANGHKQKLYMLTHILPLSSFSS